MSAIAKRNPCHAATILMADEDAASRKMLRLILESDGFLCVEAADGESALTMLERGKVDAVISDIIMPRMDGYRLCQAVRKDPRFRHLPVIVYAAAGGAGDEAFSRDLGADAFIQKPASSASIAATLNEVCAKRRLSPAVSESLVDELTISKKYAERLVNKMREVNRELARRTQELDSTAEKLRQLVAHSPAVIYRLRLEGQKIVPVFVSDNIERLLGLSPADVMSFDWWLESLHPEDRDRMLELVSSGWTHGGFSTEYRLRARDGTYRWVIDNNRVLCDPADGPQEVVGVWTDITGRKETERVLVESERRFRHMLENVQMVAMALDKNGIITFCNDYLLRLTGWKREEIIGADWFSKFIPEGDEAIKKLFFDAVETGAIPAHYENPIVTRSGELREIVWNNTVLRDPAGNTIGTASIGEDVTERKRSEEAVLRAVSALKAFSHCSTALVHARDEGWLLDEICRIVVVIAGYHLAWVGLTGDDADKTVRPVAHAGYAQGYMEAEETTWDDSAPGQGPAGAAIRTLEPQIVQDVQTDPRYEMWRENAVRFGYRSVLCLPLASAGTRLGVLCIYASDRNGFGAEDIRLLSGLASELVFGIVTLRTRAEHERSAERLRRGMESTIEALAGTLELRDAYTAGHQRRVAALAAAIGRELGLPEDEIHGIHLAATVHDLGKIQIPAEILAKPTRLTKLEFELIKTHPQAGYDLLKDIDFPWPIAQLVYQHHERLDGSGYPRGLRGGDTLIGARIMAVADTIEAMSSHRPYRPGFGIEASLAELTKNRGTLYDPAVVDACLKIFSENRFAFSA